MDDETQVIGTNFGPAEIKALRKQYEEEVRASGGLFTSADDDAPDDVVADDGEDEDADPEVTSDEPTDEDDDDDESDTPDGEDEDDDASSEEDDASAQGQGSDEPDDAVSSEPNDQPGDKKKRRGGTLKRVLSELEDAKKKIADLEAGAPDRENELLAKFEQQQEEKNQLRLREDARAAEAKDVDRIVSKMVGSESEIEDLEVRVEQGDPLAAARMKEIRANRKQLKSLMQYATNETNHKAATVYRASVKGLENIDPKIIDDAHLPSVIKHLHEAGVVTGEAKTKAEIDRLTSVIAERDEQIQALQDRVGQKKTDKVKAPRREAVVGGGKRVTPKDPDDLDDLYDPETGRLKPGVWGKVSQGRIKVLG